MTFLSLRNQLFYTLRPLIPRQLQLALRRRIVARKLKTCAAVWPIDPAAAKKPDGFPGWPDGKQFALVLIHDVDTPKGYENVEKLAALEERQGFRS